MAKNTRKNSADYNKEARKRYNEKNYKYQTALFKIEELEALNTYCKENNTPKNTLIRRAVMEYIGKSIE